MTLDASMSRPSSNTSLRRSVRSRLALACIVLAASVVAPGCATVRLEPGPDSATVERRVVGPPAVDATALARLSDDSATRRVPTGTATPTPAFGPDGRRVALHTEADEPEHDHRVHRVSVLDLRIGQIDIVHEWHPQTHGHVDPYGQIGGMPGGAGGQTGSHVQRDRTWHPVFVAGTVLASVRSTTAPFETETTQRLTPGRDRADTFGTRGSRPVVSPDGTRVLLQTHEGVAEFDVGGSLIASHPGWEPVWAPDSRRFVSHMTPWQDPSPGWWSPGVGQGWPDEVESPLERRGGLLIHDDGEVRMLADAGGGAAWMPDGERVIFWRPSAADPDAPELVEVRLSDGERTVIGPGRAPSVHPSGVVVFERGDGLAALAPAPFGAWDAPVRLSVAGSAPRFSPDGRWLMVAQPARARDAPSRAVDLVFWDLRAVAGKVAPPADDDQTPMDPMERSTSGPDPTDGS